MSQPSPMISSMEQHKAKDKKLSPNKQDFLHADFEASILLFENEVYKSIRIRLFIHPSIHPSQHHSSPCLLGEQKQ